jgi:hypothetical protein
MVVVPAAANGIQVPGLLALAWRQEPDLVYFRTIAVGWMGIGVHLVDPVSLFTKETRVPGETVRL